MLIPHVLVAIAVINRSHSQMAILATLISFVEATIVEDVHAKHD